MSTLSKINLAGEWQFALDRSDQGITGQLFTKNLYEKKSVAGVHG